MTLIKETIEKFYNLKFDDNVFEKYMLWQKLFIEYNSHTNLMSKNDIKVLFEKHVLDSLAVTLLDEFKSGIKLLDIGCGGGFPSLILAIFFSDINIYALDSIAKKTKFISLAKDKLGLLNLEVINARSEGIHPLNADILTNRAVGKIETVWGFSKKHLKENGIFVSYKSLNAKNEAKEAQNKYIELTSLRFVPYELPLAENPVRELVVFKKSNTKCD